MADEETRLNITWSDGCPIDSESTGSIVEYNLVGEYLTELLTRSIDQANGSKNDLLLQPVCGH